MNTINNNVVKKASGRLSISRVFNAPRELLWEAWAKPERLQQWFRPNDEVKTVSTKVDVRVGGRYRLQMQHADGEFYTAAGIYSEVKPPERLVFTWSWEKDGSEVDFGEVEPPEMQVTLEFRDLGRQSELTLIQEKFASDESRDRHEQGWSDCFAQLAKHVEK